MLGFGLGFFCAGFSLLSASQAPLFSLPNDLLRNISIFSAPIDANALRQTSKRLRDGTPRVPLPLSVTDSLAYLNDRRFRAVVDSHYGIAPDGKGFVHLTLEKHNADAFLECMPIPSPLRMQLNNWLVNIRSQIHLKVTLGSWSSCKLEDLAELAQRHLLRPRRQIKELSLDIQLSEAYMKSEDLRAKVGTILAEPGEQVILNLRDIQLPQYSEILNSVKTVNLELYTFDWGPFRDSYPLYNRKLKKLSLGTTAIHPSNQRTPMDLDPLSGVPDLEELVITCVDHHHQGPLDLSPVANLRSLRKLDIIGGGRMFDIAPLANIPDLRALRISFADIVNWEALMALTNLEAVIFQTTNFRNLNLLLPAAGSITAMEISRSELEHIQPLSEFTNLRELSVVKNRKIAELPLRIPRSLITLDFSETAINDLRPLQTSALDKLTYLTMKRLMRPVISTAPLLDLPSLKSLDLVGNNLPSEDFALASLRGRCRIGN